MKKLLPFLLALVMVLTLAAPAFSSDKAPDPITIDGASATAKVDKLTGNQNRLWITVTDTKGSNTENFMIDNNAAGTYQVVNYGVYVDTKGNTQIRACYFVSYKGGGGEPGFDWSRFMPYANMTKEEQAKVIEYLQYAVFPMMLLHGMNPEEFDWKADYDSDGLTNLQEYEHGTNPFEPDTDSDGLTDYEEIFVYFTDPLKADTDDDGLPDGLEIKYGMDPNNPDTLGDGILDGDRVFTVTETSKDWNTGDTIKPILKIKLPGRQIESLTIDKVPDTDIFLSPGIPGYIGNAYDFSVDGSIESATLTFEFNADLLNNLDFVPAIYYWNEEIQLLEEVPGQTTSGNNVTATIEDSCKYILLDKTVFDKSILNIHLYEIGDPGQLTGRVVLSNANGTASALPVSAQVRLYSEPNALTPLQVTTTNVATGFYTFKNVEPGRYYLELSAAGYVAEQIYNITVKGGTETSANRVDFVPSGANNGTISGTVRDIATEQAVAGGITLEFRRGIYYNLGTPADTGDFSPYSADPSIVASVTPSANGQYSLLLPPGNYTVTVRGVNYTITMYNVRLRSGSTTSFGPYVVPKNVPINKTIYDGHAYAAFDRSMTWHQAKVYCDSLGGHLATVTSQAEQTFIEGLIRSRTKNHYWLGGTDELIEGVWKWVTGEAWGYTNWDGGQYPEPNNGAGNYVDSDYLHILRLPNPYNRGSIAFKWKDTVSMLETGGFFDLGTAGFICEWENEGGTAHEVDWDEIADELADTDEDFLPDFWEKLVNSGTLTDGAGKPLWAHPGATLLSWNNPNNQDSDTDGLFDGEEIEICCTQNPDGSYKVWVYMYSNPCLYDTDGDGLNDKEDPHPLVWNGIHRGQGYNKKGVWSANPDWDDYGSIPYVYTALDELDYNWKIAIKKQYRDIEATAEQYKDIEALGIFVRNMGDDFRTGLRAWVYNRTMDRLCDTEKLVAIGNPTGAFIVWEAMNKAEKEHMYRYGISTEFGKYFVEDGSNGNAFLHCYWNALISHSIVGSYWAKLFTDAHEYGKRGNLGSDTKIDLFTQMDLYNNRVGINLGQYVLSVELIPSEVQWHVDNGELVRCVIAGEIQNSLVITTNDKR